MFCEYNIVKAPKKNLRRFYYINLNKEIKLLFLAWRLAYS